MNPNPNFGGGELELTPNMEPLDSEPSCQLGMSAAAALHGTAAAMAGAALGDGAGSERARARKKTGAVCSQSTTQAYPTR